VLSVLAGQVEWRVAVDGRLGDGRPVAQEELDLGVAALPCGVVERSHVWNVEDQTTSGECQ